MTSIAQFLWDLRLKTEDLDLSEDQVIYGTFNTK